MCGEPGEGGRSGGAGGGSRGLSGPIMPAAEKRSGLRVVSLSEPTAPDHRPHVSRYTIAGYSPHSLPGSSRRVRLQGLESVGHVPLVHHRLLLFRLPLVSAAVPVRGSEAGGAGQRGGGR